jgi:hypothetical protein
MGRGTHAASLSYLISLIAKPEIDWPVRAFPRGGRHPTLISIYLSIYLSISIAIGHILVPYLFFISAPRSHRRTRRVALSALVKRFATAADNVPVLPWPRQPQLGTGALPAAWG